MNAKYNPYDYDLMTKIRLQLPEETSNIVQQARSALQSVLWFNVGTLFPMFKCTF